MAEDDVQQSVLNKSRKDKFILVLTLPNILKNVNRTSLSDRVSTLINQDTLQYSVYGSVVPNIAIPEVDVPYAGQVPKYTSYSRPSYSNVTVNFTVDNGYNNWWVLWYWLNLINNAKQGYYNADNLSEVDTIKNVHSYETNITVYGVDEFNVKKIQFDYIRAVITGLGEINYNYRDPDQIESAFTFTFGQFDSNLI